MSAEPVRYTIPKKVAAAKLRDQLLAAGIPVFLVNPKNGTAEIDLLPEDRDRAQPIIDAHDAAAEEAAATAREDRKRQDRVTILAYARMTTAPTAAQTLAFQRALARDHLRVLGELRDEDA